MTVSSSTNKVSFNGDGSTTVFAYSFKVFDESDLTVILRASDGTETTQTITTNYTVSGVGDAGGGNVTMVTAPASGEQLTILREQPLTQGLDLVPNDPFPANSIEDSLDKLTFMVQQQQEELDRSIKASKTTTISTVEFVESAATRANKVFAFDGSGDLDLTQEIGTFQGDWAASTAYAVRDIVKDTNNNNIYIANTAHTSSGTVPLSSNADIAKWDLLVDAAAATTSANNAATSATAAATSATAAATSATAAATSESNAATSASNASTSETNAAASATNAATSESNAAGSESAAATSESNAATSATSASTSASAAATSATNAASSESNAAASQSAAATSATAAATSATSAATNATNAATSATNASTAQTAAETAQTAAEAAQAAAELAADNFDDTYLGSKSSDPTVDNDGGALNAGDLYFNTTSNTLKVYSGSAWQDAAIDSSGFVQTTGDTMTGDLDIQGTLTSDGLTVDGVSTLTSNSSADGILLNGRSDNISQFTFRSNDGATNYSQLQSRSTEMFVKTLANIPMSFHTNNTERLSIENNGDISFYEDTGTTAKFFWDASAESLGIGTSSPSTALDVVGSWVSNTGQLSIDTPSGQTYSGLAILNNGSPKGFLYHDNATGSLDLQTYTTDVLRFKTNNVEAMRIDSSGRVGIGTSSPDTTTLLTVDGAMTLLGQNSGHGASRLKLGQDNTAISQIRFYGADNSTPGILQFTGSSADGTVGGERMRLDSSGHLLFAKTSTSSGVAGIRFAGDAAGYAEFTRDGGNPLFLNRETSDGYIIRFAKDNSYVGSIGTGSGVMAIAGPSGNGLSFPNNLVLPSTSSAGAKDASTDLGVSYSRFKDLYLSGGVYLGGTGAANHLDDYEEGTFTPTLKTSGTQFTSVTYTFQDGHYTKIGREVVVHIALTVTAVSGGTGALYIGNLPFSIVGRGGGSVGYMSGLNYDSATYSEIGIYTPSGGTDLKFTLSGDNVAAIEVPIGNFTSSFDTIVSFTYRTS